MFNGSVERKNDLKLPIKITNLFFFSKWIKNLKRKQRRKPKRKGWSGVGGDEAKYGSSKDNTFRSNVFG